MAVEGGLGREKSRDDGSGAFDSLNSKEPAVAVKKPAESGVSVHDNFKLAIPCELFEK